MSLAGAWMDARQAENQQGGHMDDGNETEGMGAAFWVMVFVMLIGIFGFIATAGAAVVGGMW